MGLIVLYILGALSLSFLCSVLEAVLSSYSICATSLAFLASSNFAFIVGFL